MRKLFLAALLTLVLSGCIGRTIKYDRDFPHKINIKTSIHNQKSAGRQNYTDFILSQNPRLDKNSAGDISAFVSKYSLENELDARLVLALMAKESSFRVNVVSPSGAIGLGQLLKSTAKDMGVDNPFEAEGNVKATTKLLARLYKKWQGNIARTLASYKMGSGSVTRLVNAGKDFPAATKKYIAGIISLQAKIADK